MKYNEFELGVLFERLGLEESDIELVLESRKNIRGVLAALLDRHLRYTGAIVANPIEPVKESVWGDVSNPTTDDYYKAMEEEDVKDKEEKDKNEKFDIKPLNEEQAVEEIESTIAASCQKTPLSGKLKEADPDAFVIKAGDNFVETTKNVAPSLYNDLFSDIDKAVVEHSESVDAEIEQLEKEEAKHVSLGDAWVPNNSTVSDSPYNVVSDPFAPVGEKPAPSLWTTVGTPNQGSEKEIKKEEVKKVGKSTADPDWMTTEW